jgi:RecB family exonuclease
MHVSHPLVTTTTSAFKSMFSSRHVCRARSEKPSTVATRNREAKRIGLSAARLKISKKWRTRLYREKRSFKMSEPYRDNHTRFPEWCEDELLRIERRIHTARDAELAALPSSETLQQGEAREGISEHRHGIKARPLRPDI